METQSLMGLKDEDGEEGGCSYVWKYDWFIDVTYILRPDIMFAVSDVVITNNGEVQIHASSGKEDNFTEALLEEDGEEVLVAEQEVVVKDVNNEVNVVEVVEVINIAKLISDATTVSAATTTTATITTVILIEPVKPIKKKDLIRLDEEAALKLQAKFDEEERLTREKVEKEKEANIALIETWDDIQAKIDVDHQLAERLQAQEQEELSVEEKATLFQQLLEKRRKHFAAKRSEEGKKQTTNKNSTEKDNVYLPKEHGRIQAPRFEVERV
ncbi:hypothetical protein Tco_0289454 [Tanacetum coccineum]